MTSGSGGKKLRSFWTCRNSPEYRRFVINTLVQFNNKHMTVSKILQNNFRFFGICLMKHFLPKPYPSENLLTKTFAYIQSENNKKKRFCLYAF